MTSHAFPDFALFLSDNGPEGWHTAVLSADLRHNGHGGIGVRYLGADGQGIRPQPATQQAIAPRLITLFDALAAGTRFRTMLVEMTLERDGRFDAAGRFELRDSGVGNSYTTVLRAQLPAESLDPEPAVLDASYAGDPGRAVALLRQSAASLPSGVPAADLTAAEAELGFALPPDLRAMYAFADGDGGAGILDGWRWYSLRQMLDDYALTSRPAERAWPLAWDRVVLDAWPPDTVRRASGSPGWLPIADDAGGNFLAVDLSPARDGRPGQVIHVGVDWEDQPGYVADSVTSFLAGEVAPPSTTRSALRLNGDRTALDLSPVRDLPNLQELTAYYGEVDLDALRGLRRLRVLRLSTAADLEPLRELPVEHLTVNGGSDLSPLAGHPTLRSIQVRHGVRPADLAPLRTVPNLHGVALSHTRVADLAVLTELSGLHYLDLSFAQWLESRPALRRLTGLRAATLDNGPTVRQAIEWRSFFDADADATAHWTRSASGHL